MKTISPLELAAREVLATMEAFAHIQHDSPCIAQLQKAVSDLEETRAKEDSVRIKQYLEYVWNPNNTDSARVKLEKAIRLLESL